MFCSFLGLLGKVTEYLVTGFPADVMYLDFQKAFDKAAHCRRIHKLKEHSICVNAVE